MDNSLKSSAPGLYTALARIFAQETLEIFSSAFQEAATLGALDESWIERTPGASFNPRPARICRILMQHGAESNQMVLCAAFFACCKRSRLEQVSQNSFPEEKSLAQKALSFSEQATLTTKEDPDLAVLLCALYLDEARHLHMTLQAEPAQTRRVTLLLEQLNLLHVSRPLNRIEELLHAALLRFQRQHA